MSDTSTLFARIAQDYTAAYKAKDTVRVTVLRLLKTAVTNRLVDLRRPGGTLSDGEMLDLILKEGKQRQDSIEQFTAAGRADLADRETAELAILREYMPKPLTAEELAAAVATALDETGATQPRDMGRVMGLLLSRYKGRVDGKALSEAVKQSLAARTRP